MSRLPDFLLVGAMRAGTTSLHAMLASHPGVFMPDREVYFFDGDDFEEHAEEHVDPDGAWRSRDFDSELISAFPRYQTLFADAGRRLAGERSTTYLTAERAPERVARLLGDARIVAVLRDPVARVWSHYWHLVGSGRMVLDFEAALVSQRGTLIKRSTYAPALARWRDALSPERVHVVLFEELVADPQGQLDAVFGFLGLPASVEVAELPVEARHRHRGATVSRPSAVLAANWFARRGQRPVRPARLASWLAGAPSVEPRMRDDTRHFLEGLLGRANADLPAMLGRELAAVWPCMTTR